MWEPVAPNLVNSNRIKTPPISLEQNLMNFGMMDSMYIPSTSLKQQQKNRDESSSIESSDISAEENESNDDDDNDSDNHNLYFSAYYDRKRSKRNQTHNNTDSSLLLSACSFELEVSQGILTLYAPVRDIENRILPGQLGEFILKANHFNLFSVNGFNGNKNLAYLCMQIKSAEIYHCGIVSNPDYNSPLRLFNTIANEIPSHVQATLYPTPINSTLNNNNDSNKGGNTQKREMLSFAVEIKKIPEQRIKV